MRIQFGGEGKLDRGLAKILLFRAQQANAVVSRSDHLRKMNLVGLKFLNSIRIERSGFGNDAFSRHQLRRLTFLTGKTMTADIRSYFLFVELETLRFEIRSEL